MRPKHHTAVLLATLAAALLLTACATGSLNTVPAPVFTSTPGTAATQGSAYTYQIQTQPSTGVTFTLRTAPSGAMVAGNTLTWTPTAAQSRVANQFAVTATTSGGSATQSWSVTPAGTVSGSRIDTYWTPGGPVAQPFDWTTTTFIPKALVPQPDGSFQTLQGSGNSDGTFSIPDVPGGNYWLEQPSFSVSIGTTGPSSRGGSLYWTNSSSFDLGHGFDSGLLLPTLGPTTTVQVNYSGLDPLQAGDVLDFLWAPLSFGFAAPSSSGATTFSSNSVTTLDEVSQPSTAFLLQYEPETLGSLNASSLGPAEVISSLALQNGTTNVVSGVLSPSPRKSLDLSVEGSAWAELLNDVGPGSPSAGQTDWALTLMPFVTDSSVPSCPTTCSIFPLFYEAQGASSIVSVSQSPFSILDMPFCAPSGQDPSSTIIGGSPISTDEDFGTASYGDPFPSDWQRVFTFCQGVNLSIPFPGSAIPFFFSLANVQNTAIPTSQVKPLIGHVQNPTINGSSLFQPNTVAAAGVNLSWTPPNGTTPTGYAIHTYLAQDSSNGSGFSAVIAVAATFYTTQTSAVLPPLQSGQTFIFVITAILDGAANFETRPNRSALPTASVSVVSGPITVQ